MSIENVTLGMRVRAEWLEARPLGSVSLAGVQLKIGATKKVAEGTVQRILGDDPIAPISVKVRLMTDSGEEVTVDARHIVAILK